MDIKSIKFKFISFFTDELHEIINAKSLAITGSNVPGVVTGILTQNGHCIVGDCVYGELESYILIPW